jgi:hypothetical protein
MLLQAIGEAFTQKAGVDPYLIIQVTVDEYIERVLLHGIERGKVTYSTR